MKAPEIFTPELTMPLEEASHLSLCYSEVEHILEYGSGGSTMIGAELENVRSLISVESDALWAENMNIALETQFPQGNARVHYVDIGPTGKWGHPEKSPQNFNKFPDYPFSVWSETNFNPPDLILIDGRFRVGCFIAAMLMTPKPVRVLFDDYVPRRNYHVVEDYFKPLHFAGRMA